MAVVYVGIGTNLGDRFENIKNAKSELFNTGLVDILDESTIDETEPVDLPDQPKFLNQIILIKTAILPEKLLIILKNIEKKLGRKKTIDKGPRTIDLDILLYDDILLNTADLKIPHPEIRNRGFIIKHLNELNPHLVDPVTGEKY